MKNSQKKEGIQRKDFEKLCHDIKNSLAVLRINLDLFVNSEEYDEGKAKTKKFVKLIDKQVSVLTKKLSQAKNM